MKSKKGNAYAAVIVITLIVILFIGYWVMIPVFAKIFNTFNDDTKFNARYTTEKDCVANTGTWTGTKCNQLDDRAKSLIHTERRVWLIVPFIVVLGLILWYWTQTTKKDYQQYGG